MSRQQSFFLNKFELLKQEHPEKFEKKRGRSSGKGKRSSSSRKSTPKIFDCSSCGLCDVSKSGRIERQGRQGTIMIVGTCPSKQDDSRGTLFTGSGGTYLNTIFKKFDINFYQDCIHTNVVQCAPCKKDARGRLTYTTQPSKVQLKCCAKKLDQDIAEVKPDLIICLGGVAMRAVLDVQHVKLPGMNKMHGKVIPSHKHNCWVGCSFNPSYILLGHKEDEAVFIDDFLKIFSKLGEPLPKPFTLEGNHLITDSAEAINLLEQLCISSEPIAIDYETNCISAHDDNAKLLTVGLSNDPDKGYCIYLANPDWNLVEQAAVYHSLKRFLQSNVPKVVQNFNMEEVWSVNHVGASMNKFVWDTMVSTHVINCRSHTTKLGFQVYELTGHDYKEMVDITNLENEPIELVSDYNCLDARYTIALFKHQKKSLEDLGDKQLIKFNNFYISCLKPLATLKDRGIKIDTEQLDKFYVEASEKNKKSLETIGSNPGVIKFQEKYDKIFNMDSPKQLSEVLYDIYSVPSIKKTATGESTDVGTLTIIKETHNDKDVIDLIDSILAFRKNSGFLERVTQYKELIDSKGFIHPTYNLNIAESFRSSATSPNSQNIYKRDKELYKFRKVIIPTPGNILLECDYDALEVKVIAMASKDKNLTKEILKGYEWQQSHPAGGINPFDPHSRWASEIYEKKPETFESDERYKGKNGFVFPSFYGSVEASIARTFPEIPAKHISKVQQKFWKEYEQVKAWQNHTLDVYHRQGYVQGLSGFRRPGPLTLNKLYNTPIQGTAFHLLLDGLKQIVYELKRRGLKCVAFLEVHDSITFDCPLDEVEEVIELANSILCSKRFEWQGDIPTTISWEMGENWFKMEEI